MFANTLFATAVIFLALGIWLLGEYQFLIPYRRLLWERYASPIATFSVVLFINLFAAIYLVARKLFLKDTGRKLAHFEKEVRTGSGISEELRERLSDSL